jgi:hypothetical protein
MAEMMEDGNDKLTIKTESLPARCEVCHQTDQFDPLAGNCSRCANVERPHAADPDAMYIPQMEFTGEPTRPLPAAARKVFSVAALTLINYSVLCALSASGAVWSSSWLDQVLILIIAGTPIALHHLPDFHPGAAVQFGENETGADACPRKER